MANYYQQFSIGIKVNDAEREWLTREYAELAKQNENAEFDDDLKELPVAQFDDDTVYFWSEENADLELLIELLERFLEQFRPNDWIALEWSFTCDKPRVDAFGGGAAVIRANKRTKWMTTSEWIAKQIADEEAAAR